MIYGKFIIIGSHVTVGAPRERGMLGGVRDRLQVFPSLASPPTPASYFLHSLAVSFPLRAFMETPAKQANVSTIKVTFRVFVLTWWLRSI